MQNLNLATNKEWVQEAALELAQLDFNTVYAIKQSGSIDMVTLDK